jgi:hypothetical protein
MVVISNKNERVIRYRLIMKFSEIPFLLNQHPVTIIFMCSLLLIIVLIMYKDTIIPMIKRILDIKEQNKIEYEIKEKIDPIYNYHNDINIKINEISNDSKQLIHSLEQLSNLLSDHIRCMSSDVSKINDKFESFLLELNRKFSDFEKTFINTHHNNCLFLKSDVYKKLEIIVSELIIMKKEIEEIIDNTLPNQKDFDHIRDVKEILEIIKKFNHSMGEFTGMIKLLTSGKVDIE